MRNMRAENPKMDAAVICDPESVFFFWGTSESNSNLDPSAAREQVVNFMRMPRGI